MNARTVAVVATICAGLLTATWASASKPARGTWTKSDELALRKLISSSDVSIGLFLNSNGLPYQALIVPNEFVVLYRKSPVQCLTVLEDIVEHGTKPDAIAAFQFGYAGDEPQIALPPFHCLSTQLIDSPVGNDADTYRDWCLEILQRRTKDLEITAKHPSLGNRNSSPREF
jgi:hypothetical protein